LTLVEFVRLSCTAGQKLKTSAARGLCLQFGHVNMAECKANLSVRMIQSAVTTVSDSS